MDTAQLIKQVLAGDRDAFGQLYKLYKLSMMKVIESYVHSHDVAQDILHDGFMVAYLSLSHLNKPQKFESWLTTIMRNLSLQYLRDESNYRCVPVSDIEGSRVYEENPTDSDLSWEELNGIIDRLPDGYNKVFRFAVLEGLSHKEIGKLLGIAPHSSSSQLSHAKAMLRKLITEYRAYIGVIGVFFFSAISIWLGINQRAETGTTDLITKGTNRGTFQAKPIRPIENTASGGDKILQTSKIKYNISAEVKENSSYVKLPLDMTAIVTPEDSVSSDTISVINKIPIFENTGVSVNNDTPVEKKKYSGWELSLSYVGYMAQTENNKYQIPDGAESDIPSGGPDKIEVNEKNKHYMPLVVGLSLNKSLSARWSFETGIRYTFLRSDFLCESEYETTENIQRIHYVGIPLKFNCRIFSDVRFSLYGHGGIALDIPVNATQSVTKFEQDWNKPTFAKLNVPAPLQWSVEGGLGVQYRLTSSFSIYAEPSLRYYFNPGSDIRTIRQNQQIEFTIPLGIRLNW